MTFDDGDPLFNLRLNHAAYRLGFAKSSEFPRAADQALSAGLYSISLDQLASTKDPVLSDVGPLLERTLEELGVPLPSEREAAMLIARFFIQKILTDEAVEKCLNGLWRLYINVQPIFPKDRCYGEALDISALMGDFHQYEDFEDQPRVRAQLYEDARAQAAAWLARHPI
jgi:hypothetical protein